MIYNTWMFGHKMLTMTSTNLMQCWRLYSRTLLVYGLPFLFASPVYLQNFNENKQSLTRCFCEMCICYVLGALYLVNSSNFFPASVLMIMELLAAICGVYYLFQKHPRELHCYALSLTCIITSDCHSHMHKR